MELGDKEYFGSLKEEYISPFETSELHIVSTFYVKYVKRFLDIVLSLVALIVFLPVNIVVGIVTMFDVGFPLFFSHQRPGLGEKAFTMVKFRNMTNAVDENGNLLPPDKRVTKWGSFVRRTSLDELLQFWLILKGDMSIIGPRPLLMSYLPKYSLEQHKRHCVKPGLECPRMITSNGGDMWDERIANDLWYVENVSFKTDVIMFFKLFALVFNSKRSKTRGVIIDKGFKEERSN